MILFFLSVHFYCLISCNYCTPYYRSLILLLRLLISSSFMANCLSWSRHCMVRVCLSYWRLVIYN